MATTPSTRRLLTATAGATALAAAYVAGWATGGQEPAPASPSPRLGAFALAADLAVPESCEALLDSYVERGLDLVGPWGWDGGIVAVADFAVAGGTLDAARSSTGDVATSRATTGDHGTNVQEAGVDEPDVVKVTGSVLVRLDDARLSVWDVAGAEPREVSTLDLDGFAGDRWRAPEMLLVGGRVVVLGAADAPARDRARVTTVDLADPGDPEVVDTVLVDAELDAARLHGDVVRVVLRTPLPDLDFRFPRGARGEDRAREHNRDLVRATTLADWLPTVAGEPLVDCADVAVPDDDAALGTTTVLALRPGEDDAWTTRAVAAASTTSYFSADRLYLAQGGWDHVGCWADVVRCVLPWGQAMGQTRVHAFALDGVDTTWVASGEVDGTIRDRWSMDAVGGSLRLAVGPSSETGDFNSVLTLREDGTRLVEEGRVDHLGDGEQIKAVRWFDDLALVVTFRQVDPLYALDLSDPAAPRLLGELKVPGFSEYLHPLGERRLLGVGQDATRRGTARGAQAALFDVTDLTSPRRLDVVGYERGTVAGAGLDPRQFTWLPERRTALTVVSKGWVGRTGWVSVLTLGGDGTMRNRMVEVEHGADVDRVRLVPLASGRVLLVTGDGVSFFELGPGPAA